MGGPCGCGDMSIEQAWRLQDGSILALDVYHGCAECHTGIGLSLYLFPPDQQEWLEDVAIQLAPTPDASGGNRGYGLQVDLLEVRDLIDALPHLEAQGGRVGPEAHDYATLADWLHDHGITLLRQAFTMRAQRLARARVAQPHEQT